MASSRLLPSLLFLLTITITTTTITVQARPGFHFHPCKTLLISRSFTIQNPESLNEPQSFTIFTQTNRVKRFLPIGLPATDLAQTQINSDSAQDDSDSGSILFNIAHFDQQDFGPIIDRDFKFPRNPSFEKLSFPLEHTLRNIGETDRKEMIGMGIPFGVSSLRERTKDILSVVVALLFGVGCGALTSATMYLAWSVFSANRYEDGVKGSEEGDDDESDYYYEYESPKKGGCGYVNVAMKEEDGMKEEVKKEGV